MKWIRTECGKLFNDWNEILFKEIIVDCDGYTDQIFKIKKQGDNLIDVLEIRDDVFNKVGHKATLTEFDKEWTNRVNNGNKYYKFIGKWFNNERISGDNIVKVITHEQSIPHFQEVTND